MYRWKSKGKKAQWLNQTEIKLFIFFFLTYSLFVHWSGWNEYSRFDLTRAIVDEGRFKIDTYHNNTGDSAYYNGHYYSDKAPGTSFLAVPIYFFAKQVFDDSYTPTYIEERVTFQKNVYEDYNTSMISNLTANISFTTNFTPSELELNSMPLIVIFTSVLFSSLGVVLIYKLSNFFLTKENLRIVAAFTYGLGTLVFPYALVFFEHSTAAFFSLASFYLIYTQRNKPDKRKLLFAGILSGIGVTISYVNILVLIPMLLYAVLLYKKDLIRNGGAILIGAFIGLLPLFFYNISVFGKSAETAYSYVAISKKPVEILIFDPAPSEAGRYGRAVTLFNVKPLYLGGVMPRLLFLPYRGLFFYYPVLMFAILGLYQMRKQYKKEASVILAMFVLVLLFNTFYGVWWGGGSFGPRYMTVLMPFLMIPLFVALANIKNKYMKLTFFLLLSISIFHNFVGVQTFEDFKFQSDEDHNIRLNSFRDIGNPLYDYYLPLFLERGSRSHILENIFDEKRGVDIRDLNPAVKLGKLFTLQPIGMILLELRFVSVIIVALMFWVLWRADKNLKIINVRNIFRALLIVIIVLLLANLKVSTFFYSNDWNEPTANETGRWMAVNGTIYLHSPTPETFMINITIASFLKQVNIDVFLDNKYLGNYDVYPQTTNIITDEININAGENVAKINSNDGCQIPFAHGLSDDRRCLSIHIADIKKFFFEGQDDILYAKNWYPAEEKGRWMSKNATAYILRNKDEVLSLNISLASYSNNTVSIVSNGDLMNTTSITTAGIVINIDGLRFKKGLNKLQIIPQKSCGVPALTENSTDTRCLSIFLRDLNVYQTGA